MSVFLIWDMTFLGLLALSQDRIDFFFSHDWETSRLLKWLSLLVMFNSHAAATAMMLVARTDEGRMKKCSVN